MITLLSLCGMFRESPKLWPAQDFCILVTSVQCMVLYWLLAENCGACLGERIALPAYPFVYV
ncbi:hypothetical protein EXN66_Car005428 [Channa argus]|uniref:Uncharacterized protein n=1 Tax=Channa argus TaxID=215402 RepID=A0A6G1PIB4_CHAAH|nr:hypothetical protein EXN66_Car005428 [Channa argus]